MNIIESDASVIEGTDGNDFICAGPSDNTIRGGDGHDIIYGRAGKDRLIGGAGADVLRGGQGADILRGFRGADELFGNAGRDQLFGGRGKDVLEGGAGNDTLNGGLGRDTLIGGNGNDTIDTGDNSSTHTPVSGEAANVALIQNNPTRNTQYDDNPFRDVPMNQISVSDLTVPGDLYNAAHLDTSTSGFFRVTCEVSHFAYDDPIVFPGQPGAAHLHMFFGNTEANAYSTFDSLLNTGTSTCNGQDLNRTAYWVPALLDRGGNALVPYEIMVYYKNDNFRLNGANELVEPFADNLRMLAGNGGATEPQTTLTGGPDSLPVVSFLCGPAYQTQERSPLIPDCRGNGQGPYDGQALEMQIAFPQCFDPSSGTYLSDQSHMSYSEGGYFGASCPDSHPEDLSSIMYRIFYSPDDYGGVLTDLHLSSDVKADRILPGGTTSHGDWFGAWHPEAMDMWVENCNNTQVDCENGLLGRSPDISLVRHKDAFHPAGYRAPARELAALCPGQTFDASDPLRSVANCHHG